MSRWARPGPVRLGVAVLAVGAIAAGAVATDAALGPRSARPADPAAATAGPDQTGASEGTAYLTDAVLACPGTGGELPTGTGVRPEAGPEDGLLRVAPAPQEIFGQRPAPEGAGRAELDLLAQDGGAEEAARVQVGESFGGELLAGGWARVTADGTLAPGLVGTQAVLASQAGARGLTLTPCTAPTQEAHLVGGGSGAGRVEMVVVTNPGGDPVSVDLEVYGADGPVRTVGGTALVVPPEGRLVRRLDALAPGVEHPVVRVVAYDGPVVAHLADQHRDGTSDLGRELVGAATEPALEVVVPALPVVLEGTVSLRLLAQEDAVVELRALTEDGAAVPGTAVVRVAAGQTVQVDVDDLPDGAGALRLRSDVPVTAGSLLQVAPASEEPIVADEAASTAAPDVDLSTATPDDAAATSEPDATRSTAAPDDAAATSEPDATASTAAPDDARSTAGPDPANVTSAPGAGPGRQQEPVRWPAGELAWVAATSLSTTPLGLALPQLPPAGPGTVELTATLAVSAVDATTAQLIWLTEAGSVRTEEVRLANDTTRLVAVAAGTAAVWVIPTGEAGVVAALHLQGEDAVGPYLAATTVPAVPWTRPVTTVVPVVP